MIIGESINNIIYNDYKIKEIRSIDTVIWSCTKIYNFKNNNSNQPVNINDILVKKNDTKPINIQGTTFKVYMSRLSSTSKPLVLKVYINKSKVYENTMDVTPRGAGYLNKKTIILNVNYLYEDKVNEVDFKML